MLSMPEASQITTQLTQSRSDRKMQHSDEDDGLDTDQSQEEEEVNFEDQYYTDKLGRLQILDPDQNEIVIRRIRLQLSWAEFFSDELPPVSIKGTIYIKAGDANQGK